MGVRVRKTWAHSAWPRARTRANILRRAVEVRFRLVARTILVMADEGGDEPRSGFSNGDTGNYPPPQAPQYPGYGSGGSPQQPPPSPGYPSPTYPAPGQPPG